MQDVRWFSAKMRFVILVEGTGGETLNDRVYVFRSNDFPAALERALEIGRRGQSEYRNGDGMRVQWSLMEIISLDMLTADLDGAEVYSEPVHLPPEKVIPFDTTFRPEDSQPTQTI